MSLTHSTTFGTHFGCFIMRQETWSEAAGWSGKMKKLANEKDKARHGNCDTGVQRYFYDPVKTAPAAR